MRILLSSIVLFVLFSSCSEEVQLTDDAACPEERLIWEFTDTEGINGFVYEDGSIYISEQDECTYIDQYFNPDFRSVYFNDGTGMKLIDGSDTIPTITDYTIDFESASEFLDIIATDLQTLDRAWTTFTLQSPSYPIPENYNALKSCILSRTCDFQENRIQLIRDPYNSNNQVLQFHAFEATPDMVTSKCSIGSELFFFEKGNDIWYQSRFLIEGSLPTTLVDFESSYFLQYPGPRVAISGGAIAIENKFGDKVIFRQEDAGRIQVPLDEWFTLKVHLGLDDENGIIEVWQDGVQIISTSGPNIHLPFTVQNALEVGISATSESCTLYVDDIHIANQPF